MQMLVNLFLHRADRETRRPWPCSASHLRMSGCRTPCSCECGRVCVPPHSRHRCNVPMMSFAARSAESSDDRSSESVVGSHRQRPKPRVAEAGRYNKKL